MFYTYPLLFVDTHEFFESNFESFCLCRLGRHCSYLAARNAVCACVVKASSAGPFPAHRAQAASWMGVCGTVKLGRVLRAT